MTHRGHTAQMMNRPNADVSFHNTWSLLDLVDKIRPHLPTWSYRSEVIKGNVGDNGEVMMEEAEMWFRDIREVLKELARQPDLDGNFMTAPDLAFADPELTEYIIGESSLAGWWAAKQVRQVTMDICTMTHLLAEEASKGASRPKDHNHARHAVHQADSLPG
jgi:hypothetical protein